MSLNYGKMLTSLLEYEKSTGKAIPTHPFDLANYIRSGAGKELSDDDQKKLFVEAVAFLEAERRQPVAVAPTAALLAAHDKLVPPAIPANHGSKGDDGDGGVDLKNTTVNSVPQINVFEATARGGELSLAKKPSSLYGNPSMGNSVGPSLTSSARPQRSVIVSGTSPRKGYPVPRTILSNESNDGSAEAADAASHSAENAEGKGIHTRILKRRTCATSSPLAIKYNGTGSTTSSTSPSSPTHEGHSAHPNSIVVDEAMSNISRATAITATNPEALQRACQELFVGPDSEVEVNSTELSKLSTVGAYVLLPDEEKFLKEKPVVIDSNTGVASPTQSAGVEHASKQQEQSNHQPKLLFPAMDPSKRFHVETPLHSLNPQDPFRLYEVAEQTVERADGSMKSLFEASEVFERAGQSFASLSLFRMAANCEVRKHDCLKATNRLDDAGQALVTASHYHTQETLMGTEGSYHEANDAALAAMQNAIGLYDEMGRDVTAAKLCTEAAELCLKARNPGLGVDVLHVAAQTFLASGQNGYAEKCLQRAAEIAIFDMGDFAEAIDTLEKLAKFTPQATQYLVYFKALLCRLVCIPAEQGIQFVIAMEDCQKTLELYTDICPALLNATREYNLLREILGTQKHMEDDRLEQVIAKYIEGNKIGMERWTELLLKKIHQNLVQRKASIERLYKL